MTPKRHVILFRHGRSQAVRIPREFELEGDEAIMPRDGDRLIIEPVPKDGLLALLSRLDPIEVGIPSVDESAPELDDIVL